MKKAVVVGGSSGIGLAMTKKLIDKGYLVEILSRTAPEDCILPKEKYNHIYCDLNDYQEELFCELAKDENIEVLFISSGYGYVADFEYYHQAEIEKMFQVNTISAIKTLSIFYNRILSQSDFYVGIMGSISGWLSTPSSAVYAASKAGLVSFIESVNIELEKKGSVNRILDISPASFKGSKFNGGENDLSLTLPLADEIVEHLFKKETLFIPKYEEVMKGVIERYHNDPHGYGLYSYDYKENSGRKENRKHVIIGYLSGTFDLFHVGHLNLLRRAKQQCDYLIVGVHDSGKWKGKETFIPFDERKEIVRSCRYVDKVVDSGTEDSDAWDIYHYDKLFVGSDYKGTERFQRYEEYFKDKGVKIVYFPYTQSTSSTQIRKTILLKTKEE